MREHCGQITVRSTPGQGTSVRFRLRHAIERYHWPGNVRELENVIERAAILCKGDEIDSVYLPLDVSSGQQDRSSGAAQPRSLDQYFRDFVRANEEETTETELARRLGISRKTLWEKRKRFGLPRINKT